MSPPGRPKGEYRSAQHEGNPVSPPGRPKGEYRSAQHEGRPVLLAWPPEEARCCRRRTAAATTRERAGLPPQQRFGAAGASALALVLAPVLVLVLLAACASDPPTRFHSLLPAEPARAAAPAAAVPGPNAAISIVLDPVRIPAQVDQPQWLVRLPDGSLQLLEQDRWASPLRDELRAALLEALALRWNASAEVGAVTTSGTTRPWRITVDLVRFESVLGREVRVAARWRIAAPASGAPALACDTVARESGATMVALAEGHQRLVVRLADEIGTALQALARNVAARCPGAAG